jgi:hypothetical protein
MEIQEQTQPLITVLYSSHRDLYQVPAMNKECWLSVQVYALPAQELQEGQAGTPVPPYLGGALTADGKAWRKVYAKSWSVVQPGTFMTVAADDPLVMDYAAFREE